MELLMEDPSLATEQDLLKLNALYDEEIAYLDSLMGEVLLQVEEAAGRRGAVVVFTSDHGEQFGEHGNFLHKDLYQENIHVPLIVRGVGVDPGVVDDWTQTIDLLPTLATLSDITPGDRWQGRDLTDALAGGTPPETVIHSDHGASVQVLIEPSGLKYIRQTGRDYLFDLNADPTELTHLAEAQPEDIARLREALETLLAEDAALLSAD